MLGVPYLELLAALHTHLTPRTYLEVGTETGASLAFVGCGAIAVHPTVPAGYSRHRQPKPHVLLPDDVGHVVCDRKHAGAATTAVESGFLDGPHGGRRAVESANGVAAVVTNCEELSSGSAAACAGLPADWPRRYHPR
jgi:hypothetical protein